jgi:signal transduction histidine kinase
MGEAFSLRIMRLVLVGVWLVGGALTVVHAVDPLRLSLDSVAASPVLETVAACGATLLAALSYGRWRQSCLAPDLITCAAFSLLAVGNVLFVLLPMVTTAGDIPETVRAAAFVCGAVSALLFLVASLAPERLTRLRRDQMDAALLALAVLAVAGAAAVAASNSGGAFSRLSGAPSTEAAGSHAGPVVSTVQVLAALAFAVGSIRFARRARRNRDPFYGWLAVTAALWALARSNFSFTPPHAIATQITVGDWLRLGAYVVAVIVAAAEFTSYWRRLADTAVLEERRRIARDLHDGLAQELAFIATQSRALGEKSARMAVVARAAERALDDSRRAIAALTRPVDEPLDVALAQQAEEIGGRMGIRVLLELEPVGRISSETKEALLRIAREAMTNAGRHGRPSKIVVGLANHDGVTLRVADDGRGFRPDDPRVYAGGRYGVEGMRERAEALGGRFSLQSRPFGGTKIEVWTP